MVFAHLCVELNADENRKKEEQIVDDDVRVLKSVLTLEHNTFFNTEKDEGNIYIVAKSCLTFRYSNNFFL